MLVGLLRSSEAHAQLLAELLAATPESHGDWGSLQAAHRTAAAAAGASETALAAIEQQQQQAAERVAVGAPTELF
jgi:hypothetical protein